MYTSQLQEKNALELQGRETFPGFADQAAA